MSKSEVTPEHGVARMSETVIVSVNEGKIRGIKRKSPFFNEQFYSFNGVPYAEPPIGNLRFEDPVKIRPWENVRDATIEKDGCSQYSQFYKKFMGSEDCLYVNIHTPSLPSAREPLKAVVVLIHPGGNVWGSPDSNHFGSPNLIMSCDIVYVAIGYRLNILGFLNLSLETCSGNQALKDIVLALRWINDNIQFFNGNPANITLLGVSSSATIIHFLLLSPAAKGLFHKSILMGNYAFDPVLARADDQAKLAFDFAYELGFQGNNPNELLLFLKNVPDTVIIEKMPFFAEKVRKNTLIGCHAGILCYTIDQGPQAVLPMSPRKLIPSIPRIPLIFGICDIETISAFLIGNVQATENENIFKNCYRQNSWGWMYHLNDAEIDLIDQKVKSFYFQNFSQNKSTLAVKEIILTDIRNSELYETLLDLTSSELPSSVYLYKFSYDQETTVYKRLLMQLMVEEFQGTYHSDDFFHWSRVRIPKLERTRQIMDIMAKLFTTFAKTGNPNFDDTVQWKPSTPEKPRYLCIKDTLTMIEGKFHNERQQFWEELKKRYRRDTSF